MIDDKDQKILKALMENSRATTQEISQQTNIPITTVHNRIKRLEQNGTIKQYTAVVDERALGYTLNAFVLVSASGTLPNRTKISPEDLAKRIRSLSEVMEVHMVVGTADFMVKCRCTDINALNTRVLYVLKNMEGIDKVQTLITLERY